LEDKMGNEKKDSLTKRDKTLTGDLILDPKVVEQTLEAINQMSAVIKAKLHEGHDYGVIPGTEKPTLLKPGAEKMIKLLGLADLYEIIEKTLDWDKPFFFYEIKCVLKRIKDGAVVSEGLGSCNSMEDRFRWRWLFKNQLRRDHLVEQKEKEKTVLVPNPEIITKSIYSKKKDQWYTQYRTDNENIHSLVNTIMKMAEKRAMVDAALHAGRLSDLFSQDLEDIYHEVEVEAPKEEPKPEKKKPGPKPKTEPEPQVPPAPDTEGSEAKEEAVRGEELPPEEKKEPQPITEDTAMAVEICMESLRKNYNREIDELTAIIASRVGDRFGSVPKEIPGGLTEESGLWVLKVLNYTIKEAHLEAEANKESEESF